MIRNTTYDEHIQGCVHVMFIQYNRKNGKCSYGYRIQSILMISAYIKKWGKKHSANTLWGSPRLPDPLFP